MLIAPITSVMFKDETGGDIILVGAGVLIAKYGVATATTSITKGGGEGFSIV